MCRRDGADVQTQTQRTSLAEKATNMLICPTLLLLFLLLSPSLQLSIMHSEGLGAPSSCDSWICMPFAASD